MLKEFRGHVSFVHAARFSSDGDSVMSAGVDCTITKWDTLSGDVIKKIQLPNEKPAIDVRYCSDTEVLVTSSGTAAFLMSTSGTVIQTFEIKKTANDAGPIVGCAVSNHGEYVYALTEAGTLTCFEYKTGKLLQSLQTGIKRAIGLALHPKKNLLACYSQEGVVQLFRD